MYRAVLVTLVLLVLTGLSCRVEGKVIPYRKLTPEQRAALDASQHRLATLDRELQGLEYARRHGRISSKEYAYEAHDLTAYIAAESKFQNNILVDDQPFPDPPVEVERTMATIGKYAGYAGVCIVFIGLRILPAFVK